VLYLLEVDGIVAAFTAGFVFSLSGLVMLSLLAWRQAKEYLAARHRIYERQSSFVNPLVISRSSSRFDDRTDITSHNDQ
jgi:hypothetical protein